MDYMRILCERTQLLHPRRRNKRRRQRRRTAGCNKVYFSRYYVKLASLAELELFKKHSAAVVAVGSLNMHGGKCPPSVPLPRPAPSRRPRAFLCLRNAVPAHAIILAHLRTLRSGVDMTAGVVSFFSAPSHHSPFL